MADQDARARKLEHIRSNYTLMRPSEVFALRMRETRKAHGMSQVELARKLNTAGVSLSKQAILRIENGDRGISLDEALAIALALNAVPAYMLTPPGDALVALSDDGATDGSGVREWLRYGLWSSVERRDPPDFARDDFQRERFQLDLAALALALVDAKRGNDQAGVNDAFKAIVDTVKRRIAEKGANGA